MYLPKGYTLKISAKDLIDDGYAIDFSDCLYTSICCGQTFELHRPVVGTRLKSMQFKRLPITYSFIKKQ